MTNTVKFNTLPDMWSTVLGVDLETSGLDPYTNTIHSVALSDGETTWIYTENFEELKELLENQHVIKIMQNAAFDIKFLKHLGIEPRNVWDTLVAEKLIYAGTKMPASLDHILARRVGKIVDKNVRESFIDREPFSVVPMTAEEQRYIVDDVVYLPEVRVQQLQELKKLELSRVTEIEMLITPATAELEYGGLNFDAALWETYLNQFDEMLALHDAKMRNIIGGRSIGVERTRKGEKVIVEYGPDEINLNSYSQLQAVLNVLGFEADSTAAAVLESIVEDPRTPTEASDFSKHLLEYRKYKKRAGFDYPRFVNPVTKRVHPSYHQNGTVTGRYSNSNPNMQQVPRPDGDGINMRHLWKADNENYMIIRADYSQQEPRVLAQLSGDKQMIAACNESDVYVAFGRVAYGETIDKKDSRRHIMKTFVLSTGYGAGTGELARASGLSYAEAENIKRLIKRKFPVMTNFAKKMDRMMQSYGYVTTALGRRRNFETKKDMRYTEAVNAPVQGTAADMFKLALAKIYWALTDLKQSGKIEANTRVWHIVHDEICVHCHKDDINIVEPMVQELMEAAGNEICPDVTHIAETEVSKTWDK